MKIHSIFFIILSLFILSCSKKTPQAKPPVSPVTIYTVQAKNIPYYIDTLGHFIAFNSVTIQAQVQGQLMNHYFEEGETVCAGDLLFKIDDNPFIARLDKALATLKQNKATLAYNLSRQERYSGLVEEDFVSQLQYTQYVTELESYEAIIQENEAEIESAAIELSYCTIDSPISGVVGKRLVDDGNIITDVGTEMLVVNQVSPLYVDFAIPERHFDDVHQMQQENPLLIEIYVPNTNLVTHAHLQMINNTINPNTGMIALRGVLENENQMFWPQQFVRVRLIVDTIPSALMVPPEAIIATASGQIVWVVDSDNTARIAHVETGEEYNSEVRILKGLKPGQRVITRGQLPLREGSLVAIKESKQDKEL